MSVQIRPGLNQCDGLQGPRTRTRRIRPSGKFSTGYSLPGHLGGFACSSLQPISLLHFPYRTKFGGHVARGKSQSNRKKRTRAASAHLADADQVTHLQPPIVEVYAGLGAPALPTDKLPGSDGKVAVMVKRAAARRALFLDDDTDEDERRGLESRPGRQGKSGRVIKYGVVEEPDAAPETESRTNVRRLLDLGKKSSKFSTRLKKLREHAELSQRDLARLTGISKRLIELWEHGHRDPVERTRRVAKALGCSWDELFGEIT
jgi:DNA-binding transcriptional regulator YiaG